MVQGMDILWNSVLNSQLVLIARQQVSPLLQAPLKVIGNVNSRKENRSTPFQASVNVRAVAQACQETVTLSMLQFYRNPQGFQYRLSGAESCILSFT